jgi:hypothetical protein
MNHREKLNISYQRFKLNPSDANFETLYETAQPYYKRHRSRVRGLTGFDDADALTIFDDAMLKLCYSTKIHNCFERALNSRLNSRRKNLLRDNEAKPYADSIDEILDSAADEGTAIPKALRSEYDLEQVVLRKTEADHRQVIDSLIWASKPDATTTAIVEAMLVAPASASRNEIARSLGIHHEVVNRKLRALSRNYDVNRFGDYREFLAA